MGLRGGGGGGGGAGGLGGVGGLGGAGGPGSGATAALGLAELGGWIKWTREPCASFKSAAPDKTHSATEELLTSSLTRECGSIRARLRSVK